MCLNHEGSIFKVTLLSKIIDVVTRSASRTSSFPDFLEHGQEFGDMAVPGGDKRNIINSGKGRRMVYWIKNQEMWADLQLRNELPSVAKYLFCLGDLERF